MTAEHIQDILTNGYFPGIKSPTHLIETHISWVILTPDSAFKIKKPVQFDFLDFSDPEKRRYYCEEELRLNRRLTNNLYRGVIPIGTEDGHPVIGSTAAPVLDYAVWMYRMDEKRQMDLLLRENKVTNTQMEALAVQLANFHRNAVLYDPEAYSPSDYLKDFEDLYHEEKHALQCLGSDVAEYFRLWRKRLPLFLNTHAIRMRARFEQGFWLEGHGDLHARNIFLVETPVVFDCIEFNPHFRRLDVLNELAFLYMDLEVRGQLALAQHFMESYCQLWSVKPQREDELLFLFFKAYRANIRLKIGLLELRQHPTPALLESTQRYWTLLKSYCEQFL